MAPISSEADLLDHALKSKTVLPSWRSIFTRLTAPSPVPSHATITRVCDFLCAPSSLATLSNCHDPFPPPSTASKTEFEKRTAAINFTAADQPNGNGTTTSGPGALGTLPVIGQLKEEALELSRLLEIDEVAALRTVVLEYQSRPARDLASASTGLEDARDDERVEPVLSEEEKKEKIFFDRLLLCLSERKYVIKVATFLLRVSQAGTKNDLWKDIGRRYVMEGIIEKGGNAIKVVESIGRRWTENTRVPGWLKARVGGPYEDEMIFIWEKQNMLEIVHLLQYLFIHTYLPVQDIKADLVIRWFSIMKETRFFTQRTNKPQSTIPDISNLYTYAQGLTSVLSAAFLQMPRVEKYLLEEVAKARSPDSAGTTPENSPPRDGSTATEYFYIQNPAAIKAVTDCLKEVATMFGASLATMTWVIILDTLRLFVRLNDNINDEDGIGMVATRKIPVIALFDNTLTKLFSSTVEVGIKNLANSSAQNMMEIIALLLESSDVAAGASSGTGFWLGCEEDHLRMKNVLAYLVRKAQAYLELSTGLVASAFLVHDVDFREQLVFRTFMEQEEQIHGEKLGEATGGWTGSPAARFWQDQDAKCLLNRAKNRFPYETMPFLQIMKGLASEGALAVEYLTGMMTYTQLLPYGFRDYYVMEDETDPMRFVLESDLVIFHPRQGGVFDGERYGHDGAVVIPAGALGVVTSTGGSQPVVAWHFEYNALILFGRVLESALGGNDVDRGPALGELAEPDTIIEIVALLTKLISSGGSSSIEQSTQFDAIHVLAEASDAVSRQRDIVAIIFDLLEDALQSAQHHRLSKTSSPIRFATTALQFIDALVPLMPGRVWPYVARSALLEQHGRGGAFAGILSSVEVVQGYYSFTLSSLALFEDLVDQAVKNSVSAKGGSTSLTVASRAHTSISGAGVNDIVQKETLLEWTKAAVDIFESYRGWKYKDFSQKTETGTRISRIFITILDYVYGIDESSSPDKKITAVLVPSAQHLVMVFLSAATNTLALEPIIGAIVDGIQTPESSLYLHSLAAWADHVAEITRFADVLVRVRTYLRFEWQLLDIEASANLRSIPPSRLEKQLFEAAAFLTKLYAVSERYKRLVLELMQSLVSTSISYPEEPPSLLGHLGSHCANNFVALLGNLDKPYDDAIIESRIWNLVSAVVSNKQQGMSILLLRGEALRGGGTAVQAGRRISMMSIALDTLVNIDVLEPEKSLAMLEFLSTATDFWSLAMVDLARHPRFLDALTKHADKLQIEFLPADSKDITTQKAYAVAVAAHVAKLIALYTHSRGAAGGRDDAFLKQLIPRLEFYFGKAVKVDGYRRSLHVQLQKNFEEKWPTLKLVQLRKTKLRRVEYGKNSLYDIAIAGKVLGFDPSWGARADGYAKEVEEVNVNSSLINTQVELLESWQILAVELCQYARNDRQLAERLVKVVETCLQENINGGLPTPIFANVLCSRAEFAFVIVSKLYNELADTAGFFDNIFKLSWKAITTTATEFHQALVTAEMDYYRSLLRIIYVTLLASSAKPKIKQDEATVISDLLNLVVAQGFRCLAQAAHTHPIRTNPQDIALITAILQAALRINGMNTVYGNFSSHLAEHDTIRAATTLFSWAEKLETSTSDPIYGELSALFLFELSSIPLLAEHLAIEGVLDLLLSSTLAQRISCGVSAISEPRLHLVWSRGLLPLALNLLVHIGARMGREIVLFLKFFKLQIQAAVVGWAKPTVVTLPAISEATAIAMLIVIVTRLGGGAELDALGFDRATLVEGIDYLLSHRNYLATLVVPVTQEQEDWSKKDSGCGAGGNKLVEKAVAGMLQLQTLLGDDDTEE